MNNFTRALTAILANTAFVWGECAEKPDLNGLVTIPATWTKVPNDAFYECADLKEVVIPRGVTEISHRAFYKSGLEVILFEDNSQLKIIRSAVFADTSIVSIVFPSKLKSIGSGAFNTCSDLKEVVIPRGVTEISDSAFYFAGLEVILFEFNSQLETIGSSAFDRTSIVSIVIPQGVTSIGDYAFYGSKLEVIEFEFPSQLETIGISAFAGTFIVSIVIPQGVTSIGSRTFAGTSIRSIVIPQGVTSFDENNVFEATPCADKTVFKPGNTVVNCEVTVRTTMVPTTLAPTTAGPTTPAPTTMVPTTLAPTTTAPTTMAPTTAVPTTMVPTTLAPTTAAPTTMAPTEVKDPCANLNKRNCKTECVFSKRQRQCLPKSISFEHDCAQYERKTPCLENKVCKFPHGKCIHRCDGKNVRRCRKHKFCNLDKVVNPCFGCHLVTACGPRR